MAVRELIFDIFAVDRASKTLSRVGSEAEVMGGKFGKAGKLASAGIMVAGAVAVDLGIHAVKMAGNFDAAITRLETTAGESPKALKMVGDGLLAMAGKVGYTAQELAVGMYTVESAGFHGAAGLKVMEAAAKGARVEGADLTVTTDAISSLLVDYHLHASDAAMVTNVLTAAVGHGKTTFQGMAAALPNVAAAAASAKISMAELTAAIATMTMHGTDASKAGTYLRQVIGQLEAPTAKARETMKGLGIDSNHLGMVLSSGSGHGLADAIQMVDDAISKHMTPHGLVAIEMFRKSKDPVTAYQKVLADLPPSMTTTFGALTHMVGGVKSLQGFLQLGGENLKTFRKNTEAVREQVRKGGKDVAGFAQQQETLNGKLADAKGATTALAVEIGHDLTPAAKTVVGEFTGFIGVLSKHETTTLRVIEVTALLAAGLIAMKAATGAATLAAGLLGGAETALALRMTIGAVATGDMAGAAAGLSLAMGSASAAIGMFAGAAGVGLLIASSRQANQSVRLLETSAGGAALGFAVGGPLGAALGFTAGAIYGVATATHASAVQMIDASGIAKRYAASLRDLTDAGSVAAREAAQKFLADPKSSFATKQEQDAARRIGISQRDLVNVITGETGARSRVAKIAREASKSSIEGVRQNARLVLDLLLPALDTQRHKILGIIASNKEANNQIETLGSLVKKLPAKLQTTIEAPGAKFTLQDVKLLALQYHLTPKNVQTLIEATNVPATVAQILGLQHDLGVLNGTVARPKVDPSQIWSANNAVTTLFTNFGHLSVLLTPSLPGTPAPTHHPKPKKTGHAGGTSYASAGWSRIDEAGAEDVWLPNGARVDSATITKTRANSTSEATARLIGAEVSRAMHGALRGMTLTGTLDTPFGPANVKGVVQSEKARDHHFDRAVGAMKRD